MAWTAPRTWVADQVVTAAQLNTDIRDNLAILKLLCSDQGTPRMGIAGGAAKTTDYTATTSDYAVAYYTATPRTLTLYAASGNGGRLLYVINMGSGAITVDANASELIDGATTCVVPQSAAVGLWCDGTNWWTIADTRHTAGAIVQQATVTFTTTPTAITATAWTDVTGVTTNITPRYASSVIEAEGYFQVYSTGQAGFTRLAYGATPTAITDANHVSSANATVVHVLAGSFTPGATTTIALKLQAKVTSGGTCNIMQTIDSTVATGILRWRERIT